MNQQIKKNKLMSIFYKGAILTNGAGSAKEIYNNGLANGNGLSFLTSAPLVLRPDAGRTSLDALQLAAVSIPPYLTRKDA